MTPSEALAARYAAIFTSLFDRIAGDWRAPWTSGGPHPQQNMDGDPYRGMNAMLTSATAAARGFALPVWMTHAKAAALGCAVLRGEHGTPVVKYEPWYLDRGTGMKVPDMTDEQFALLPRERRDSLERRCHMRWFTVFNIGQTDFREVYPRQYGEILSLFGVHEPRRASLEVLDRMVDGDGWLCPVRVADVPEPAYLERYDRIDVPPKGRFADQSAYYVTLLHEMVHSTGSEERLDRTGRSSERLDGRAREELVAELGAATLATLAGLEATIREDNLRYLKAWSSAVSDDPDVIYQAVADASRAANLASRHLGLEQAPGFDLTRILDGIDRAQEAAARRFPGTGEGPAGHRKGWSPVRAHSPAKGITP
ncbi:MAG: DUF1738 domain-containing protein [Candidatus Methanomethylophilus sp.]|nr:DUF1738 domain-containing protein [Methanomethylophilus sp.]